jgi:hypothetical protein
VIVNKGTTLHLRSLDATLEGFRQSPSLGPSGPRAPAHQKLAVFSIKLTNRLGTPQHWQANEAVLFISTSKGTGNTYAEDAAVEGGPGSNACLTKISPTTAGIRPGASISCELVFAVPASANAAAFGSTLDIANFGHSEGDPSQPVGVIRTFH